MDHHWSFGFLKKMTINDKNYQNNLEDLKSLFRNEIGSARNMSRIQTMEDLLDCLERHDALSETNIEPLREIADQYGGELEEAISSYVPPKELKTAETQNEYREIRLAEELRDKLNIISQRNVDISGTMANGVGVNSEQQQHMFQSPVVTPSPQPLFHQELCKKKRAAIYKMIAENIGTFWRSFGRELELNQGALDEIEMEYPRDLKSRVFKMFQVFEEDASIDPKKHLILICRALDDSRRKDLRRKIEDIMSH